MGNCEAKEAVAESETTAPEVKLLDGQDIAFPDHWGRPPRPNVAEEAVQWPAGYGSGGASIAEWIRGKMSVDLGAIRSFPPEWGDLPTAGPAGDTVEWPEGWGTGSPVVGQWIDRHLHKAQVLGGGRISQDITSEQEAKWKEQQKAVEQWEVKEIMKFLECAGMEWGLDDEKVKLVHLVQTVQRETLEKYLDQVAKPKTDQARTKVWKEAVDEFLGTCLDSINTRPPTRKYGFIHIAAMHGNVDVLTQLVKLSADVFWQADDGSTARSIAKKQGHKDAEEYLESVEQKHTLKSHESKKIIQESLARVGQETLQPRLFKRNKDTMFSYEYDSHFTAYSKLSQTDGWDCSAMSIQKGVTKITVKFEPRGTTKSSGLADIRKRPFIFGLVSLTDKEANPRGGGSMVFDSSWLDLSSRTENPYLLSQASKGVWACCEMSALMKNDNVASTYGKATNSISLPDVTPADILIMEKTDACTIVIKKQSIGSSQEEVLKEFRSKKAWGDMYGTFMMYDPNDCVLVSAEPGVSYPAVLRQTIGMQSVEYRTLLTAITRKLLPDWLREELTADSGRDSDPTDKNGHMMYVASLITMLSTRSWSKAEGQAMDSMIRSNYKIPFNHDWVDDFGKVLKKIWNNGGVPSLGNLRAVEHSRVPGSCKNKAVLALVIVDAIRPRHQWVAWCVWRARNQSEAEGRFPHKKDTPVDMSFCQLHCVNAHLETHLWFDVIRFWDRDPHHKWPLRYPDPELLNVPTPSNFDLTAHTEWMRDKAAPGGTAGYGCPKTVPGTVPYKLALLGVTGDKVQSNDDEEEEEEDSCEL
jgi:hypothetical protein